MALTLVPAAAPAQVAAQAAVDPAIPPVAAAPPARPCIGLALDGGGSPGATHIGVLEVLESLRVPVHCVAGTSMGALVAGTWAAGLSPAEMRKELAQAMRVGRSVPGLLAPLDCRGHKPASAGSAMAWADQVASSTHGGGSCAAVCANRKRHGDVHHGRAV